MWAPDNTQQSSAEVCHIRIDSEGYQIHQMDKSTISAIAGKKRVENEIVVGPRERVAVREQINCGRGLYSIFAPEHLLCLCVRCLVMPGFDEVVLRVPKID